MKFTAEQSTFWQQHVERFQVAGLSRPQYCQQHGIKTHQLEYQLRLHAKKPQRTAAFAKVVVADANQTFKAPPIAGVRILFGKNAVIELNSAVEPEWLARLMAVVGCQQ
jgi:hypothetical protein